MITGKKIGQDGIAHLMIILVVVVLLVVGGAGYFIFTRNKEQNTQITSNSGEQIVDEVKDSQEASDNSVEKVPTLQYKDEVGRYTVDYPQDWTIEKNQSIEDTMYANIKSPSGVSITFSSNLGGRGIVQTCSVDESTGKVTWTEIPAMDGSESRDEPCPYSYHHKATKLNTTALDKQGNSKNAYIIEKSTGTDKERTYGVCIVLGSVTENKKIYGVDFVDPDFNSYKASGETDRWVRACIDQKGTSEDFFKRADIIEAKNVLSTFTLL